MINKISDNISIFVENHFNLNEKEKSYFNYGLQLILGLLVEAILILFISWVLNIFWPVVFASLSFLVMRPSAGGIHLPTYFLCLVVSILVFILIGIVSVSISLESTYLISWIITITILGLFMLKKYAPADTETMPINDPVQRKKLQKKAIIILLIWSIFAIISTFVFINHHQLILASSLGIMAELVALHPILFSLVKNYLPEHD